MRDRAPQRDLVRRVAADDRIVHVEERVSMSRRLTSRGGARCRASANSGLSVAAAEHVGDERRAARSRSRAAPLSNASSRGLRFLDDADLDAADQRQLAALHRLRDDRAVGARSALCRISARRGSPDSPRARCAGRAAILQAVRAGADRILHRPAATRRRTPRSPRARRPPIATVVRLRSEARSRADLSLMRSV